MEAFLAESVAAVAILANKFGTRMEPHVEMFREIAALAYAYAENSSDREALESKIAVMDDAVEVVAKNDILFHHINALCDTAAAIGCILDENPYANLESVTEELSPALLALSEMKDSTHGAYADNINLLLERIKAWLDSNPKYSPSTADGSSGNPVSSLQEHTAAHLLDYRASISDAVVQDFSTASVALGGKCSKQAGELVNALNGVYDFIVTASLMSSAPSDEKKQEMASPIAKYMTSAAELSASCLPSDPFFNHVKAIEEAMAMVSWVVASEKPFSFVTDADASAAFYLNKVLMTSKKHPDAALHKAFVDALKAIFPAVKSYVKEHHTTGIRYGIGIAASLTDTNLTSPVSASDEKEECTYVTAFADLIAGPLDSLLKVSKELGGDAEKQAYIFEEAWKEELELLKKAYVSAKPSDDEIQKLIMPLAGKLNAVADYSEKLAPSSPFSQHCAAVAGSVSALGWVAVDEKAAVYVGDMAGVGQFYIDMVKTRAKGKENAEAHRAWAKNLQDLYVQLKAYVKQYHTQALVWNPPKVVKRQITTPKGSSAVDDDEAGDYVSLFRELINGQLTTFVQASKKLGGAVEKQAAAFASAWEAEAEFLAKAISMPKPEDPQIMVTAIAEKMGEVGSITESLGPRDPFANHCNAVSESIPALGWVVVDEKAAIFVGDMSGTGQFYLDKVKVESKKKDNPEAHKEWASSLETLWRDLKTYVKENHTQKLIWNPPKRVKKASVSTSGYGEDDSSATDYVSAFKELLSNELAAFTAASENLGGIVSDQAVLFAGAWEAEADFLEKAMNMAKPDDIQPMLGAIVEKMGAVGEISSSLKPRDPFAHHCNAISESIGAIGWIAVDEKATIFVGDMSGAGQFYLDKVKIEAKKKEDPAAHREWAKALEILYASLKAYVKQYHTQKLVWNPPKAGKRTAVAKVSDDGPKSSDYVEMFKKIVSGPLAEFQAASSVLGGVVDKQAIEFGKAWDAEADLLSKASKMPKPANFDDMLKPIADRMGAVSAIADEIGSRGEFSNHCSAVSESIGVLGWVNVDSKAAVFVNDMAGAGQFFLNKVKMGANKTNNATAHRTWAKSLESLYSELHKYVKEYHTQRLVWNSC